MPKVVLADISPVLRRLISELQAEGLGSAAQDLQARCFAAYTTSSEWLGEVGAALERFRSANRGRYSSDSDALIDQILREVGRVWTR
ncbi:MAG TPA: hypothetical protein VF214_00240 [Edaphobacter sp.]